MIKYDAEAILNDVVTVLTTHLSSKITEINSDKNDGVVISPVDSNAIFLLSLDNVVANYDPFILVSVDITSLSQPSATADILSIPVTLALEDDGDADIVKKVLRYMRALKEVFQENFALDNFGGKLEIQSLMPMQFKKVNSSALTRVVGVELKVYLP